MIDDQYHQFNADMQVSVDNQTFFWSPKYRETASSGVVMRTISTNDIEKFEVIRGIPSAAYGGS